MPAQAVPCASSPSGMAVGLKSTKSFSAATAAFR